MPSTLGMDSTRRSSGGNFKTGPKSPVKSLRTMEKRSKCGWNFSTFHPTPTKKPFWTRDSRLFDGFRPRFHPRSLRMHTGPSSSVILPSWRSRLTCKENKGGNLSGPASEDNWKRQSGSMYMTYFVPRWNNFIDDSNKVWSKIMTFDWKSHDLTLTFDQRIYNWPWLSLDEKYHDLL